MKTLNPFEKKVLSTIRDNSLLEKGDSVLVGLSGGKDSSVLLYVLSKLSDALGIKVSAFHLNHLIRGDEAKRDEYFSRDLCLSMNVPFYTEEIDVPALAKKSNAGLEAVAREARYSALERCANRIGALKIATAHTLSDNSETLMISLLRTATLSPIPVCRGRIIRPLINVTTEELLNYAAEQNIPYVTDSTNLENDYLRNFLRNEVLPSLRTKNSGLDETLAKSGKIFSSYRSLAVSLGEKYFEENPVSEKLEALKKLAEDKSYDAVLFYVLSKILFKSGINLTYERFEKIAFALRANEFNKTLSLSDGKELVFSYGILRVEDVKSESVSYRLDIKRGENKIPDTPWTLYLETLEEYVERTSKIKQKINKLTKNIKICGSIITNDCYIRPRVEGDKYRVRGITRSLKKYFIDIKLDRKLRDTFPIVCDSDGILWVAGLGLADRATCDTNDMMSLSLEIQDDFER